ncbi:hypothetical protein EIP91_012190 [Steccherinum ochraceum]|uniref:Uncharacterized protein n=1 Tax=Steccherinum ochraceum TaxID=92696 RepID=A0A4R0RNL0_9APHY|nr:hypothetical protein EIP91_012190 [Steccherinum ochraceum]
MSTTRETEELHVFGWKLSLQDAHDLLSPNVVPSDPLDIFGLLTGAMNIRWAQAQLRMKRGHEGGVPLCAQLDIDPSDSDDDIVTSCIVVYISVNILPDRNICENQGKLAECTKALGFTPEMGFQDDVSPCWYRIPNGHNKAVLKRNAGMV